MATLARKRKFMFIDPRTIDAGVTQIERVGMTIVNIFYIVAMGGLIASATGVVSYLVFSGWATKALATIMAHACLSLGNCADFSGMLSGLASALISLFVIALVIGSTLFVAAPEPRKEDPAYETAEVHMLMTWYSMSGYSREVLLTLLESSDAEPAEQVLRLLREEHRAIEEVMSGGG